jgi:hypothetical protein
VPGALVRDAGSRGSTWKRDFNRDLLNIRKGFQHGP